MKATTSKTNAMLSERAMLVSLNVRTWTARKLDKRITDEINSSHNAAPDAGRYNKSLLPREALKAIEKIEGKARTEHYKRTLPWSDNGQRILSASGYIEYTEAMRELRLSFQDEVRKLVETYPDLVESARTILNGMFNPDDYPSPENIARRFDFDIGIFPVPISDDFRVTVGDEQAEQIRKDIEARVSAATQEAVSEVWQRTAKLVGHMAEKLRTYKPSQGEDSKAAGIFRDSLVGNIKELAELMPSLNITNDPKLNSMAKRLKKELCQFDAADLRESDSIRAKTAEKAEKILEDVSGFLA